MLAKPVIYDGFAQRQLQQGDAQAAAELVSSLATVGAGTITGALLAAGILNRTGPTAAFTDTTDTATNIIAALSSGNGVQVGTTWRLKYLNTVGFTCTLAAGTNVTLSGKCNIPPLSHRDLLVTVTNGTPGRLYPATVDGSTAVITGMTADQTKNISVGMAVSGTGVPASTTVISVQQGVGVTISGNTTVAGTNVALTFAPTVTITSLSQRIDLPLQQYVASTAGTSTLAAGDITGAEECTYNSSGGTTPTLTTRTADQMIADIPNAQIGMTWKVKILNRNSGQMTVGAGSGVTITGTATLATVTWKEFICTYTAASTIVMQVGASALL